jgi:glycine/D-amino acid oxidase-like deaminating enzyme
MPERIRRDDYTPFRPEPAPHDASAPTRNVPVWDDEAWTGLPRLEEAVDADVCVVGLGGSGLACVGELLALGARVAAVDAVTVGSGAAGRNGGLLLAGLAPFYHDAVAAFGREQARTLYRLTLGELERMAAETPEVIRRPGSLRIAASADEAEDCDRQLAAMRADGLPVEAYDGPEGRGLLLPTDGVFQPLRRCRALARRAVARGARLYEHSRAVSFARGEVVTHHGRVRCERVIVAVDGALEHVLPALAGRVRTARLQMLATAPTDAVHFPRPVYTRWGYDYWQQLPGGQVVLGGFRDMAAANEWTHATVPTAEIQAHAERFLRQRLGVRAPITHRWAATVAYSDTRLPILEELRPGLWATGAYSGTGNVVGAVCGRAAAQLAAGGHSPLAAAFGGANR